MDKNRYAILWESLRLVTVLAIILYFGDWFGLNSVFPYGNILVIGYHIISLLITIYFVKVDFKNTKPVLVNS
jgi:alkylglycerol monooxygenase